MHGADDPGADERPGRHAEEREAADDPERQRPGVALEDLGGPGRRDRDQDAPADGLHDPSRDELVKGLRAAGEQRTDREDRECQQIVTPVDGERVQGRGEVVVQQQASGDRREQCGHRNRRPGW